MTERDCLRNGDWRKIKYYPVSVEKLQQVSMREAAYLIAPVRFFMNKCLGFKWRDV
jgi:hypothetical protein